MAFTILQVYIQHTSSVKVILIKLAHLQRLPLMVDEVFIQQVELVTVI